MKTDHNRAFLKLLDKRPEEITKSDIKDYIFQLAISGYRRETVEATRALRENYEQTQPI